MSFRRDGDELVSDTVETVYRVEQPFQHVLQTLPGDSVPRALIMLGILTETLEPVEADIEKHIQVVTKNVDDKPPAAVPAETVRGIMWLLNQVRESLNPERKQTIGKLVENGNLNSPDATATGSTAAMMGDSVTADEAEANPSNVDRDTADPSDTTEDDDTTKEVLSENDSVVNNANSTEACCEFCDTGFPSEGELISHAIDCQERPSDARFKCEYCKNEYISEQALRSHLHDCDETVTTHLNIGGNSDTTERHDAGKTNTKPIYDCNRCGEQFNSPQQLIKHKHSNCSPRSRTPLHSDSEAKVIKRGATGSVAHFNTDKGYGFITVFDSYGQQDSSESPSEDLFFHVNEYPGETARVGEALQFDIKKTDTDYIAVNISSIPEGRRAKKGWDDTLASSRPRWGKDT